MRLTGSPSFLLFTLFLFSISSLLFPSPYFPSFISQFLRPPSRVPTHLLPLFSILHFSLLSYPLTFLYTLSLTHHPSCHLLPPSLLFSHPSLLSFLYPFIYPTLPPSYSPSLPHSLSHSLPPSLFLLKVHGTVRVRSQRSHPAQAQSTWNMITSKNIRKSHLEQLCSRTVYSGDTVTLCG